MTGHRIVIQMRARAVLGATDVDGEVLVAGYSLDGMGVDGFIRHVAGDIRKRHVEQTPLLAISSI